MGVTMAMVMESSNMASLSMGNLASAGSMAACLESTSSRNGSDTAAIGRCNNNAHVELKVWILLWSRGRIAVLCFSSIVYFYYYYLFVFYENVTPIVYEWLVPGNSYGFPMNLVFWTYEALWWLPPLLLGQSFSHYLSLSKFWNFVSCKKRKR